MLRVCVTLKEIIDLQKFLGGNTLHTFFGKNIEFFKPTSPKNSYIGFKFLGTANRVKLSLSPEVIFF